MVKKEKCHILSDSNKMLLKYLILLKLYAKCKREKICMNIYVLAIVKKDVLFNIFWNEKYSMDCMILSMIRFTKSV